MLFTFRNKNLYFEYCFFNNYNLHSVFGRQDVATEAECDKYTPDWNVCYLYVMTGSDQGIIQTSKELNTTDLVHMEISNLKQDKKCAFAIVKANDGFTLTGTISSYSYLANFC